MSENLASLPVLVLLYHFSYRLALAVTLGDLLRFTQQGETIPMKITRNLPIFKKSDHLFLLAENEKRP